MDRMLSDSWKINIKLFSLSVLWILPKLKNKSNKVKSYNLKFNKNNKKLHHLIKNKPLGRDNSKKMKKVCLDQIDNNSYLILNNHNKL